MCCGRGLGESWGGRRRSSGQHLFQQPDSCLCYLHRRSSAALPNSPPNLSRNTFFCTFPVPPFGSGSANTTDVGHLKCVIRSLHHPINSSCVSVAPTRVTTTARIVSPHLGSGTPITAASKIPGCPQI